MYCTYITWEEVLIKIQAHTNRNAKNRYPLSLSDTCRPAGCKKQFKSPTHLINSERREEGQQVHILCI